MDDVKIQVGDTFVYRAPIIATRTTTVMLSSLLPPGVHTGLQPRQHSGTTIALTRRVTGSILDRQNHGSNP